MIKTLSAVILISVITSGCGSFNKATTVSSTTNYFPAKKNKNAKTLIDIPVNADTLRTLLVVPESEYSLTMGKNLDYFNEVIYYSELQKRIIQNDLQDKVPSLSDLVGLNNAAIHYKPFVILETTKKKKDNGWYAGLRLYDPKRAETIFENEIYLNLMWDGWTDQGTMFPLYNSLLDYLRKQQTMPNNR